MVRIDFKKIKDAYGVDPSAEVEGKWFDLSMIAGASVKVARTTSPSYQKALERKYRPYQKQIRKGVSLATEIHEKISVELISEELLRDWKGIPGINGKDIPFSIEIAKQLLSDPELKEFKTEISDFSEEFDAFRLNSDEELEKN